MCCTQVPVRKLEVWLALVVGLSATAARAEPTSEPPPPAETRAGSPKREVPNYDGRGPEPVTIGQVMLWVPRILLSPLYFTSEFILRRPLGALTIAVERADLARKAYDFFAFGPDHKAGVVPVAFVEYAFNPTVGFWAFWNDAFHIKDNELRGHFEVWPSDWYAGSITDRLPLGKIQTLELRVFEGRRPDNVFYGIGPNSERSSQSRYTDTRFDARLTLETRLWRLSRFDTTLGIRKVDLFDGHYGSDPSLSQEAATGAFPIPYGFDRGYLDPYGRVLAALDTRLDPARGSGVRIEGGMEVGGDVKHSPSTGWVRWGGAATAFVDLTGYGRIASLALATQFADPIASQSIPYTELASLGGDKWMHGFYQGRMLGRSTIVAVLKYAWPVAPWLSGDLQLAMGNAFDEHLSGFDAGLLRLSAGLGLTTMTELPIEILIGFGTDTVDNGLTPQTARVTLGVPHTF